ncbi:hypothetical protein ACFY2H_36275 [Streptomyces griseofuscus]|uniref:hypothetical protein n=1 Tax=Streptomyces griseofuscus TaxID=146922 RepID=UPI0036822E9E
MSERDFIALIDGAHQLVKGPIVLVWDRLNTPRWPGVDRVAGHWPAGQVARHGRGRQAGP